MNNAAQQIVTLYEEAALSPDKIAEVEGLELTAVKAILFSNSGRYRTDVEAQRDLDFNDDDNEIALRVFRRIAQFSEDDNTALKAAKYIRDDKKGRLDARTGLKNLKLNVTVINEHIRKAIAATAPQPQQKVIEV